MAKLFLSPYSCFISDPIVFFVTFLAPIFLAIIFNIVIFILVARVLVVHAKKKKMSTTSTIKTMISIVGIMVMFGLTWLFGALTVREASTAFQYLFVIFNGFQGFFFFVFICLLGKDGREFWIDVITCCRIKRKHARSSTAYSRTSQYQSSQYIKQKTVLSSVGISNQNFAPQALSNSSSRSGDSGEFQSEKNGKVNDDIEMGSVIINHEAIITGSLIQEVDDSLSEPMITRNLDANSNHMELELGMTSESDTGRSTETRVLITQNECAQDETVMNGDLPSAENASQSDRESDLQKMKVLSSCKEEVEDTRDGECDTDEECTNL